MQKKTRQHYLGAASSTVLSGMDFLGADFSTSDHGLKFLTTSPTTTGTVDGKGHACVSGSPLELTHYFFSLERCKCETFNGIREMRFSACDVYLFPESNKW